MGCTQSSPELAPTVATSFKEGQSTHDDDPTKILRKVSSHAISTYSEEALSTTGSQRGEDDTGDLLQSFFLKSPLFAGGKSNRKLSYSFKYLENSLTVDILPANHLLYPRGAVAEEMAIIITGAVSRYAEGEVTKIFAANDIVGAIEVRYNLSYLANFKTDRKTFVIRIPKHLITGARIPPYLSGVKRHMAEEGNKWVSKVLSTVDILSKRISNERLSKAANLFNVTRVGPHQRLYTLGERALIWYVLAEGKVVATMSNDEDPTAFSVTELKTMQRGAAFGECALISKKKSPTRPMTVSTLTEVTLLTLDRAAFDRLGSTAPDLQQEIIDAMRTRTLLTINPESSKFTRFLSPTKIEMLATMAVPITFSPNADIMVEGSDHHKTFYLIAEGSADVFKGESEEFIRTLQTGEYFGELSLVTNRPHSATVRAGSKGVVCLAVSEDDFSRVFVDEPSVYAELRLRVLGPQSNLRDILYQRISREAFMRHCEKEVAQENVQFFFAVEELETHGTHRIRKEVLESLGYDIDKVIEARFRQLVSTAREIYFKFVDDSAPLCVNIDDYIRKDLAKLFESEEYAYDMFAPAKDAVYRLMEGDNFSRFHDSWEFEEVLDIIGPYDPEEKSRTRRSLARKMQSIASRKRDRKNAQAEQRTVSRNDQTLLRDQIQD